MENELNKKRGLIFILVIGTITVFIGLVWLITKFIPMDQLRFSSPSLTPSVVRVEMNCTYPITYWMEHPELYPIQIVIGSKIYQANDIREALMQSGQNPIAQLQAQLVGAFLNISSGADQRLLESTIFQAYNWLVLHPDGSQVSGNDLEIGARFYSMLQAYNLGLAGVPPCEGGFLFVYTETPTPSVTATFVVTLPYSQTITATASETASPTYPIVTPIYTYAVPTQTRIATTQPPGGQVPTETRKPNPSPTRTAEPPTPTRTPIPSTPTFTPPPQPTSTYTPPPQPTPTT
jgi:hypothetical protein